MKSTARTPSWLAHCSEQREGRSPSAAGATRRHEAPRPLARIRRLAQRQTNASQTSTAGDDPIGRAGGAQHPEVGRPRSRPQGLPSNNNPPPPPLERGGGTGTGLGQKSRLGPDPQLEHPRIGEGPAAQRKENKLQVYNGEERGGRQRDIQGWRLAYLKGPEAVIHPPAAASSATAPSRWPCFQLLCAQRMNSYRVVPGEPTRVIPSVDRLGSPADNERAARP